jgi:hypothetical protein
VRRIGQVWVVLAAWARGGAAPPPPDSEPNNSLVQAEGSLKGGQDYTGGFATQNDRDWYVFYVAGQQQLDIAVRHLSGDDDFTAVLRNGDGTGIDDESVFKGGEAHIRYTTPAGTNRFYLELRNGSSVNYRFRIDPQAALVDGPTWGSAQDTPEPNESASQPFGLLSGGILYAGGIQTDNDVDWFAFHALGQRGLDVSIVNTGREGSEVEMTMVDSRGLHSDHSGAAESRIGHIRRRSPSGITRYLVKVEGDLDVSYQVRIDPADALTQKPIEPCYAARRKVKKLRQRIKSLDKAIAHARTKARRTELRKKRNKVKKQLATALQQVDVDCGP